MAQDIMINFLKNYGSMPGALNMFGINNSSGMSTVSPALTTKPWTCSYILLASPSWKWQSFSGPRPGWAENPPTSHEVHNILLAPKEAHSLLDEQKPNNWSCWSRKCCLWINFSAGRQGCRSMQFLHDVSVWFKGNTRKRLWLRASLIRELLS